MNRVQDIRDFRADGLSWRKIGDYYGISGQAVQLYYLRYQKPRKIRVLYQKLYNRPQIIYVNKPQVSERTLINLK